LGTEAISGSVLVVAASAATDALLADPEIEGAGLDLERAGTPDEAIRWLEQRDGVDVVLLAPQLDDPVRVAQRLHSLDRQGAVVILCEPAQEADVRHALELAPFLDGDVVLVTTRDGRAVAAAVSGAVARTQARRRAQSDRKERRDTPPPLSARYLGTLLDSAPIGIVTLDGAGAVIGWNKRAGEMLDVPEVEALGTPFADLFPEQHRPRLRVLIEGLETAGISADGEVFERGQRSFELTGARFAARTGERGALVILQDVSTRVAAERELDLQRALLDAQAESSLAGIAVVTSDGRLERINHRWSEIWGISEAAIRGDRFAATRAILAQVEEPAAFLAGVDELTAKPGSEFKDELRLKDGRAIERYGAHVRGPDGEIVGRVWFHTDITARKRDEDALRFLADATNLLSTSLDYETTLRRVAQLAATRIADWCLIEVGDPGRSRQLAVAHVDPAKVEMARALHARYPEDPETGPVATVMRSGEPSLRVQVTDDALELEARDEEHLGLLRGLGLRSVMIVPIQIRGRVFGAMTFANGESTHSYDGEDVSLVQELARRAAIAIDNSRVHAELRDTARTLQESLLPPHLPPIDGIELAARFRPAGAGMQVGGDFYDIFDTSDSQWGIAVGDVCGKGAEAAALTALTRYTVRAAAMYEQTAGGVLRVLNDALLRQRGDFRFTTLAFCMLERDRGGWSLRCASGGHPRPLLLRADGSTEAVGHAGPLLGVLPDAAFGEQTVRLAAGDVVVLYTDGLTDAHAPERMLEEGDVLEALKGAGPQSAGEIALQLERAATGATDAEPRDDIAILVVKVDPA
jgi:PAS domain S-box-containing protein